jgi:hypothetical protein
MTEVVETTRPKFVYYRSNIFWMDSNLEIEGWMSEERKLVLQTPDEWRIAMLARDFESMPLGPGRGGVGG